METLNTSFRTFLSNIEPSKEAKEYAQEAHKPIREHLENDETFGGFFKGSFLYGSYARHTAVGNIKDVDIVVVTDFDPKNPDHVPDKVLRKLKKALTVFYKEPSSTSYNRKSIQVNDPLPNNPDVEMTLDIIPAISVNGLDKPLLVPDRKDEKWVFSHPKGHLEHTTLLNDESHGKGMYVPLVKIMKHWWAYNAPKKKAQPKGFWIETLTGQNFDQNCTTYAEHFIIVLEKISFKYRFYQFMTEPPELTDSSMPDSIIKTSMTIDEFQVFMEAVNKSLELAKKAVNLQPCEASQIWNQLFGDEFPITESVEQQDSINKVFTDEDISLQEEFLFKNYDIRYEKRHYSFTIDCRFEKNGYRPYNLREQNKPVPRNGNLKFSIKKSNIPAPYTIRWKVKNTGEEARSIGKLRGEITLDFGQHEKTEITSYKGTHYVECYAIKDGICVAKDRIYIVIN